MREREREREKFIDNQMDDRRSVSKTPLVVDMAAGHSWPSIGSEYYTPTLRLAVWHAFQQHTRGTRPLPVRPRAGSLGMIPHVRGPTPLLRVTNPM